MNTITNKQLNLARDRGFPWVSISRGSNSRLLGVAVNCNGAFVTGMDATKFGSAILGSKPEAEEIAEAAALFSHYEGFEAGSCSIVSSYALKHLVERQAGGRYISNGACIVAAAFAGFSQSFSTDSMNSRIAVPKPLLASLWTAYGSPELAPTLSRVKPPSLVVYEFDSVDQAEGVEQCET